MTGSRPLPVVVRPEPDELLSNWLARLARANHATTDELVRYLGLGVTRPDILDAGIDGADAEVLAVAGRLDAAAVTGMTLATSSSFVALRRPFQLCLPCAAQGVRLRHWRYAWSLACRRCGGALVSASPAKQSVDVPAKLPRRARLGAEALARAVQSRNTIALRRMARHARFERVRRLDRSEPMPFRDVTPVPAGREATQSPTLYRRAAALAVEQRVPGEAPVRLLRRADAILRQLRAGGEGVAPDGAPPRPVSHN